MTPQGKIIRYLVDCIMRCLTESNGPGSQAESASKVFNLMTPIDVR